jgi:hypothetical protein
MKYGNKPSAVQKAENFFNVRAFISQKKYLLPWISLFIDVISSKEPAYMPSAQTLRPIIHVETYPLSSAHSRTNCYIDKFWPVGTAYVSIMVCPTCHKHYDLQLS